MKSTGLYPCVRVDAAGSGVVSQAGGLLITETIRASGLAAELSGALAPWRKPLARHDPAKIVTDLAVALALGGDCLADIAVLRGEPGLFGPVASDPTVSRTVDALAGDVEAVLKAINTARAAARTRVWALAGEHAPDTGRDSGDPLIVDLDATLVGAHSDKQGAAPTFKRGHGFHPLCAFVDHGPDGSGEPLAVMLRPGNAGSNTAADHIAVVREALKQLPGHRAGTRPGRRVLIRTDSAGCTHEFLDWITGQRLPDSETSRCTTSPRTRSGARSSRWPAKSPPGRSYSRSPAPTAPPTRPAAGNPNAYAYDCSPPPPESPGPAAAPPSTSPATPPGPSCCTPASPGSTPTTHPAKPHPNHHSDPNKPGPWNRRPPATTLGRFVLPDCKNQPRKPATEPQPTTRDRPTKDPG